MSIKDMKMLEAFESGVPDGVNSKLGEQSHKYCDAGEGEGLYTRRETSREIDN